MRTPTNKEYKFFTINEMLSFLTSENVDEFLLDFSSMIKQAVELNEEVKSTLKGTEGLRLVNFINKKLNRESIGHIPNIEYDSMSWIDDGKRGYKYGSLKDQAFDQIFNNEKE